MRGIASLNYTVQCISEKSFGTMVIVMVLVGRDDEMSFLGALWWSLHSLLAGRYCRVSKKRRVLFLLYSFVGLHGMTARGFPIILPSCC